MSQFGTLIRALATVAYFFAVGTAADTESFVRYEGDSRQHLRDDWTHVLQHTLFRGASESIQDDSVEHKLLFAVKQRNVERLTHMLRSISDPNSPTFREYLSFDEVGAFVENKKGTETVVAWLNDAGVDVTSVTPRGEYIEANAPISLWNELLRTKFVTMRHKESGKSVFRCDGYALPSSVAEHVHSVAYTVQMPPRQGRRLTLTKKDDVSPAATTLAVLNKAYNIDSNKGSSKVNQSIFESLGQTYSPNDLKSFAKSNKFDVATINDIGGHVSDTDCTSNPSNCGEANLDIQYIMAVAQNVPTTFWYVDESDHLYYDYLTAVAAEKHPVLVHSISYGSIESELEPSILDNFETELVKLGLMGVTVVVSSGDDGVANFQAREDKSKCGYNPSYPASSPHVLSVGATQGVETESEEIACSSSTGGLITTGGGFSTHYSRPTYQAKAVEAYFDGLDTQPESGFDKTKRAYPDIAMAGHNFQVVVGGSTGLESGTSASAPVVAGMISLINGVRLDAGKPALGFVNPTLYDLAAATGSDKIFNDVTSGENKCAAGQYDQVCCKQGFTASKGWDPLTGHGSVDFAALKKALM